MTPLPLPQTRDEFNLYMMARIEWRGQSWTNLRAAGDPYKVTIEDWETGEVVELIPGRDLMPVISIPSDPRWEWNGHRNPSNRMRAEYKALSADQWTWWTDEEMGRRWPNRPKATK